MTAFTKIELRILVKAMLVYRDKYAVNWSAADKRAVTKLAAKVGRMSADAESAKPEGKP
ncbi:MAG TPA: hypothetical protein VNM87_09570 [Candidatus Udaeobacter sp.]|nr:hypothetical protein [Candidatus Udaeobacter sp.]